RLVNEGQPIAASTPVVKFQNSDIDVVMDVPETFMSTEMRTAENLSMVAQFSSAPGLKFPVSFKEASQVADPKTQTFQVRVGMKKPGGFTALPGMTAVVTVVYRPVGASKHRIRVPISAVTSPDTAKPVVWVVGPNQVVSPRPVTMGAATGGTIE